MEGDTTRPIVDLEREQFRTYVFPETVFTAVTAYQNQLVCPIEKPTENEKPVTKIPISILFPLGLFTSCDIFTLFHKVTKSPVVYNTFIYLYSPHASSTLIHVHKFSAGAARFR
jgi:hypothetical protein